MGTVIIIICGQLRFSHLVYTHMETILSKKYKTKYVLSTDFFPNTEEYEHQCDLNLLKKCSKISNISLQDELYGDEYRNSKNYAQKIVNGCGIIECKYDYYILIRSDMILEEIGFLEDVKDLSYIYVPKQNQNSFVTGLENIVNGNIMITRNYKHIEFLYQMQPKNINNYFELFLYDYINHLIYPIEIKCHLLLSLCHVIAISGDSGSGKTTLSNALSHMFPKNVLTLETDRYHKWERGDKSYDYYTHLHPEANYLEKLENDVYNLRIGNYVYAVDYDHATGKFTQEERICPSGNIILCGLHTLWSERLCSMLNIKIYMDTEEELRKQWKTNRDVMERNKTIKSISYDIEKRKKDYVMFIESQRKNADIIIRFFQNSMGELGCRCIFRHSYSHIILLLSCNQSPYIFSITNEKELDVLLVGSPVWLLGKIKLENINQLDDFYGEIQVLIYFFNKM